MKRLITFFANHLILILILLLLSFITISYLVYHDYDLTITHFTISVLIAFIIGIAFKYLYDSNADFEKKDSTSSLFNEDDQVKSRIHESIKLILSQNIWEIIILSTIIAFILILLGAIIEEIKNTKPDSLSPTIIALLLSLFSIMVTIVGMHYAFLAERRARYAEANSRKLLDEKGQFLPHFSGFIERINRKISSKNGLLENLNQDREKNYFFVKCMFLTPFLGHAGITSENLSMAKNIDNFQLGLKQLIDDPCCEVSMVIPTSSNIVNWYSEIQWVEINKNLTDLVDKMKSKSIHKIIKKKFPEINVDDQNELAKFYKLLESFKDWRNHNLEYEAIPKDLVRELLKKILLKKSKESLSIYNEKNEFVTRIRSFNDYSLEYKTNYEEKLSISYSSDIPFQMFLVTRPIIKYPEFYPHKKSFKTENKKIIEEGVFVVLSFVGDTTYSSLIDKIKKNENNVVTSGGIKDLLENLHSAFYSEDPRLCEILNNHFNHYFEKNNTNHYPIIDEELWKDDNIILI